MTTTTLYERIDQLPQEIQYKIWCYNVEGHRERLQKVFQEFTDKKTYICCSCNSKIDMADYFEEEFSAEYFFASNYYSYTDAPYPSFGLVCCFSLCKTSRYYDFECGRENYFTYRRHLFDIESEDDSDDDAEDDYYDY